MTDSEKLTETFDAAIAEHARGFADLVAGTNALLAVMRNRPPRTTEQIAEDDRRWRQARLDEALEILVRVDAGFSVEERAAILATVLEEIREDRDYDD